ncbi:MAG: hypothetical protein HDR51_00795 [Treponema sp.]|nr:hypothetical protein [Treponema sp.]
MEDDLHKNRRKVSSHLDNFQTNHYILNIPCFSTKWKTMVKGMWQNGVVYL